MYTILAPIRLTDSFIPLISRAVSARFRFTRHINIRTLRTMATQVLEADSKLVSQLQVMANTGSRKRALVKTSSYKAPADPEIVINSWKLDEFKYYDVPSPFPTLARGLFTQRLDKSKNDTEDGSDAVKYRIVARGYDKFFNIGEVPWTKVCMFFYPTAHQVLKFSVFSGTPLRGILFLHTL